MRGEFTAVLSREEDGTFVASCAEIPGVVAEAETEEEALSNLADSVAIAFEVSRDECLREAGSSAIHRRLTVDFDASEVLPA